MKIEKLNENKIRITLNLEDLNERDIDYHSFMSNSIESQGIFLDMLNKAEKEVGFNTDDCRIMIEAIALKGGIFVLTITKFEHTEGDIPKYEEKKRVQNRKKLHIKRKTGSFEKTKTIYSFESFDTFCDFCTFLNKSTYRDKIEELAKEASLYEYSSNFYLVFTDINLESDVVNFVCPAITEFAHFVDNSELFEKKISEYGKMIIEKNALTTCIRHFV